ncbi:Stage V sporulation protein K [Streptococcus sanguinis]|uniref:Putative RuBisCo-expression protein CbbX n=3 Tax=Streptococcus sanguinis TaxID=1305 RepID=A0A2X4AG44_STRSA|nr:Stage V sporulation protein K [Streptococcus sanguinis]RSI15117.1 Stage V sporulation protein K [Streptococcus sanguinis]SQF70481.1 putative RuBisCo-expression protein CbbX [Streptococcus sanguinis]
MFFYQIEFSKMNKNIKEVDENFIQENQLFYCFKSQTCLYVVGVTEHTKEDLFDKLKTLGVNDEEYTDFKVKSISKSEYLKEVGNKYSAQIGQLFLHSDEREFSNSDGFAITDLEWDGLNIIGLNEFQEYVLKLKKFLNNQKEKVLVENQFLIFKGSLGTGKKFAIKYLMKLLNVKSKTILKDGFSTKFDSEQRLVIIKDYSTMHPRKKEEFKNNILETGGGRVYIFLAESDSIAYEISREFLPIFHVVYELNFPPYSYNELVNIIKFRLGDYGYHLEEDLIKLLSNHNCLTNSYDSCYFAQKIIEYNVIESNLSNGKQSISLPSDLFCMKGCNNPLATNSNTLKELDRLVGLSTVKNLIHRILAYFSISQRRHEIKSSLVRPSMHFMFSGASGTGKTIVARLLTKIFYEHGIIKSNVLIEVGRSDLIGEYVGQTAPKVKRLFDNAKGGILFIDEAYSLIPQGERDFANEAIPTIIQEMENNRNDVIVIFAGYTEMMEEFLNINPGLASRISRKIHFENYSKYELYDILILVAAQQGYLIDKKCKTILLTHFEKCLCSESFGNARYVRKLFELVLYIQAERLMKEEIVSDLTDAELSYLSYIDFEKAIHDLEKKENNLKIIGFRTDI